MHPSIEMNLYISWSKTLGYFVADELVRAISRVFDTGVTAYFSALSIERGVDWFAENQRKLLSADRAFILVSRKSLASPWLLYEAGVLLGRLRRSKCEVVLLDLKAGELEGSPFAHFQCTDCRTADFLGLFSRIEKALGSSATRTFESPEMVAADTRTQILLLSMAEQSLVRYESALREALNSNADPYLYDACAALVAAKVNEENIHGWMQNESVKLPAYANHLVTLMAKSPVSSLEDRDLDAEG